MADSSAYEHGPPTDAQVELGGLSAVTLGWGY